MESQDEKDLTHYYEGVNGQIALHWSRIDITRKGFKSFACHGMDGTKTIFLKSLTALQYKEAGALTNGFIQFIFPGSIEDKGGLLDAAKDENTVMFSKEQEPKFEELKNHIYTRLNF